VGGAIAGTVDILKRLKQAGYPVYGLSNWSAETFPYMRARHDFFDLFDDMVISGEVGHVKPEPEIFRILLDKIGRPAGECLFIDDSPANIQQAKNLGFEIIQFQCPQKLESSLRDFNIFF
jgi:2-haloacid dehalogenase